MHTQITDLSQVPRIDIAPRISLPCLRLADILREISFVLVRFNDIANPQSINVRAWKPPRKTPRTALSTQFTGRISILWVIVVRILLQRKRMVIAIPLREADSVCRLTARDDHFLDTQLTCRFDDVVGAQHVASKAFRVRDQHVASVGREVDDRVWGLHTGAIWSSGVFVVGEVEVG